MISDTEISNALRQDHKGDQLSVQNIPPSLTSKNSTSIYPGPTKKMSECNGKRKPWIQTPKFSLKSIERDMKTVDRSKLEGFHTVKK